MPISLYQIPYALTIRYVSPILQWGGLDDDHIANPIASLDTTTLFAVKGINEFGCSSSAFITVKASNEGTPRFVAPNAFSPNGDNKNDCFGIKRGGNSKVEQFSIYNRWGQLVFQTSNPAHCWDGTINGRQQDAGGYVYIIKARTLCGEITRKGTLFLIR